MYSATKFAQVGFVEALDDELRVFGIKVCALCPGGIKTNLRSVVAEHRKALRARRW